jgi:hypothetical protein
MRRKRKGGSRNKRQHLTPHKLTKANPRQQKVQDQLFVSLIGWNLGNAKKGDGKSYKNSRSNNVYVQNVRRCTGPAGVRPNEGQPPKLYTITALFLKQQNI